MSKPQGCTRTTSGSATTTWSQSSHGEGWPFAPERASYSNDVLPDVGERVGLEGYDLHPPAAPCGQRRLNVFQAHSADFAMILGDNNVRPERLELLRVNTVD